MALNASVFMVLFFDQVVTYSLLEEIEGDKGRKEKRIYQVSPTPAPPTPAVPEKKKKLLQVSNHE